MSKDLTKEVETWWNTHPFTYAGLEGTGWQDLSQADLRFFENIERKLRKQGPGYQAAGAPLMSNFIDYSRLKGKTVLDVASGTGVMTVEFARQGADVTAIDLTDYGVEATTRNLKCRGLSGQVLKMDAQNMTFADASFDFVCAQGCLMHMPDTPKAVREIHRVLKPGGGVYAWLYHKGWYYWVNVLLVRGILLGRLAKYGFSVTRLTSRYTDGSTGEGNPHTKFFSRRQLREMFASAGFRDVEAARIYNPIEMDGWPAVKVPIGKMLPASVRKAIGSRAGLGVRVSAIK
jgi:ubiquinone/menaquinone biosynthesis C-methylase UbiE